VAAIYLLRASAPLLIPIVVAFLVSYALEPVVAWMQRRHVPRPLGAALLVATLLALTGWGTYSLRDDAMQAIESLPDAARRVREMIWTQRQSGPAQQLKEAADTLQQPMSDVVPPSAESRRVQPVAAPGSTAIEWIRQIVGSAMALAGHLTVIVFLVFFLLLSGDHFRRRIMEIAGPPEGQQTTASIIDDINMRIQRFLLVQLVTSAVVACATWAVLRWLGVHQAAVWGILAGIFNAIPYFGPVVVSGGLFVVALAQFTEIAPAVKVSMATLAITSLEGWLLTPLLIGQAERMHTVVVFLGVLVWTWMWGAWGTVLAVPMLVVMKSIADRVEPLKPVGRLMSP